MQFPKTIKTSLHTIGGRDDLIVESVGVSIGVVKQIMNLTVTNS